MLTKVILEGPVGKKFGRVWELDVSSIGEAVRMIEVNKPGFRAWVKDNLVEYPRYKVVVRKQSGHEESLTEDTLGMTLKAKEIRIIPIVAGAGGALQTVA